MTEKEFLTKERFKTLSEELDNLKKVKRREVADQLEYAKSLGDLSENAEYHEARDLQAVVEDRIQRLESILKSAVVISAHNTDVVAIGSTIVVVKSGEKDEKTYNMVGDEESDLASGKISIHSPFGQAVIGKKKGESFSFNAPAGATTYKVIAIQ